MKMERKRRVLLIGWDAADWKVIHPLMDAGKMPNLEKLVRNGVSGNLASLRPELSPMLWTSIATGKRPFKHGILGFIEPEPSGRGVRPVSNLSRKTRTIWNILNLQGYRSVVVGWWPSHPAEPINGVMVSNHYQRAVAPHGKPWPMPPGTVHPRRLYNNLKQLRIHPQELDPGLIRLFVPEFHRIDQDKDHRLEGIAKIIADAMTIKDATVAIMHHEPWDFTAVYFDAIDHFCHGFMNFHPPRLPWVKKDDYELFSGVVESGYRLHDILLGSLLAEAGKDATVIIVSDHGFHSDHLRPARIPDEPAGPAAQHRPYGIFVISGPGIKKDEVIYGASLLDVCPTILSVLGLPVAEDMDGKPLLNIFEENRKVEWIESWDDVQGEDGSHPADLSVDPVDSSEAIRQLVELGYIDKPDENKEKAARNAVREIRYNLARSYMDAGLYFKALPLLEELYEEYPEEFRFGTELCHVYHFTGMTSKARPLLEKILKDKERVRQEAEKKLAGIAKEHGGRLETEKLDEKTRSEVRQCIRRASQSPYAVNYLLGVTALSEENYSEAERYFKLAGSADARHPSLYVNLGRVYEQLKRMSLAEKNYERALNIDPENVDALVGMSRLNLALKNNLEAAHFALDALGLKFHNPEAHYLLGCALHRRGLLSEAINALETAVRQNPNYPDAFRRLTYIYKNRIRDEEKAAYYRELAAAAAKRGQLIKAGDMEAVLKEVEAMPESLTSDMVPGNGETDFSGPPLENLDEIVVVVSGLPRSGTSMMMQMLAACGIPVYSDRTRKADEDNPRGYYESEKVKGLGRDSSWFADTRGHAIKIISHLLPSIPGKELARCRIIYMERDYAEILASQKRMLERMGKKGKRIPDSILMQTFHSQTERIKAVLRHKKVPVMFVNYSDCVACPEKHAARIEKFLGIDVDIDKVKACVDPSLYRQRASGRHLGKAR